MLGTLRCLVLSIGLMVAACADEHQASAYVPTGPTEDKSPLPGAKLHESTLNDGAVIEDLAPPTPDAAATDATDATDATVDESDAGTQ
jgi:hypothetical protein